MRYGVWGVAALLVGAFAAHFLLQDNGYVLINFRGYVVEMSVPGLVFALVVLYVVVRVLVRIWRMPRDLGTAVAEHRVRRAHRKLTRGFIHLSEGDWRAGERLLTRGLKGSDTPLVNYLMAARAAQLQGSAERRNEWLKLAYEELPEAEVAVLLTQAELQFEAGELERALATLERILESNPNHPAGLGLLAQTWRALGDRQQLGELLPRLGHAKLSPEQLESIAAEAFGWLVDSDSLTLAQLDGHWAALSGQLRKAPALLRLRGLALARIGKGDQAERELRAALKRSWAADVVRAYGEVRGADPIKQLRQAESWLEEHPEDGALLQATARLCMSNELWGKARSYLESSLALAPDAEGYALYGRLLDLLGEGDKAALSYRSGLSLASGADPDVPALDAPPAVARLSSDESPAGTPSPPAPVGSG